MHRFLSNANVLKILVFIFVESNLLHKFHPKLNLFTFFLVLIDEKKKFQPFYVLNGGFD